MSGLATRRWVRYDAVILGTFPRVLDPSKPEHALLRLLALSRVPSSSVEHAQPEVLSRIAAHYENSSVRRLGYLLERMRHLRQAQALQSFIKKAKTAVPLDPSVKPLIEGMPQLHEREARWRLIINESVEVDF